MDKTPKVGQVFQPASSDQGCDLQCADPPSQNLNSGHRHARNCSDLVCLNSISASPGGAKACSLGRKPQGAKNNP